MLRVLLTIANPTVHGGIAIAGRAGTSVDAVRRLLMTTAVVATAMGPTLLREAFPEGTGRHRA